MKRIKIFLILFLIVVSCRDVYSLGNEGAKAGDAVFISAPDKRMNKGPTAIWEKDTGHVGIYIGKDENGVEWVVDAMPKSAGGDDKVRIITLEQFKNLGGVYLGGVTTENRPTEEQRKQIVLFAKDQAKAEKPYSEWHIEQKGPDWFDCVGLAEAAYENAGLDPTPASYESGGLWPVEMFASPNIVHTCGLPPDPGNDHPDEFMGILSESDNINSFFNSNIAVYYSNGFANYSFRLLNNETLLFEGASIEVMQEYPVIVIPTGGFSGMDTSEILKYKLREYVRNGGVLISFVQQQGYEFSCLPGGEVKGYGWGEDQSCWTNAAYVDIYKPCFADQDSANLDSKV